ncbi:choice-of-anchor B family protein [Dokdonella immobilis]|uniref:Choice-of-anchor B domain-containing protein n=1 Tax=Dokdonella immobilis TaxID=578942 RepID=A0A1I4WCA4_9GAMM|nr:choice-of-anchor B family protein [Dokdonella immobilis]SFN11055.1 choice-of-anchor B domain-containing protein [Dokdonella immobilis]
MRAGTRILLCCAAMLSCLAAAAATRHAGECIDGVIEGYACNNVDLLAHMDLVALGTTAGGNGNDMWGWTDPDTGKEYALVGLDNGTAFVDISDPEHPVRLGNLATHSVNSTWRDIKTLGYYALIVSEAQNHGLQVFDLRRLRSVASPPATFTEDAWYGQFGRAHNIVVNEASGYAYAVGSRQGNQQCGAGLHMIDMSNPLVPTFAGCFSADGYTHDAQCVTYDGPDANFAGHEICFAANEDSLTIVDVSNKSAPIQIARKTYSGSGYTHQGWLTEDRRHFLIDDELDEQNDGHNTRTYVWDVEDLIDPHLEFFHDGATAAIDHNMYVHEGYAYQSNYQSGLRILDLSQIDSGTLSEAAFFDTYPASDSANFNGTWSNYPYYASGVVGVSDINRGFFVLQPDLCRAPEVAAGLVAVGNGDHRIDLSWNASATPDASYSVERILGGCSGGSVETIASGLSSPNYSDTTASGVVTYGYRIRSVAASGQCASVPGACVEASTSGSCTAPPVFAGIASAASAGTSSCAIELAWPAAQSSCGSTASYQVYRSQDPTFEPAPGNLLASALSTLGWIDTSVSDAAPYTYIVRAADLGNGTVEGNSVRLSARASGPLADGDFISGAELGTPILSDTGASPISANVESPQHVAWEIVDTIAHGGSRSYYSGYNNSECLSIGTGPISLTSGQSPTLEFWTRFGIESGYDGGVVQISTNGGQDWTTITPVGGYPGTFNGNNTNACGFPNNSGAFTGTAAANLSWSPKQFDLAAYAGQAIQLRWRFSTDGGVTDQGWWIDDIRVSHAQVPGSCSSGVDLIFADGFEAATTTP